MIWVKQSFKLWVEKRSLHHWGEMLSGIFAFLSLFAAAMCFQRGDNLWVWVVAMTIGTVITVSAAPLFDWLDKNQSTIKMRVERERMLKDPFDSMIHTYLETDGADIEELLEVLQMDSVTLHGRIKNRELKSRVFDATIKIK